MLSDMRTQVAGILSASVTVQPSLVATTRASVLNTAHMHPGDCIEIVIGLGAALLNDHCIQLQFHRLLLDLLHFHCVLRDQSVDTYLFLLANSVRPIHSLQIHLRIPVAVVKDHCVGCHEVEAEASGSRGYEKHELFTVRHSVVVDLALAVFQVGVAVQAAVFVISKSTIVLQNVEHCRETRKD